jgi:beta-glucosidase
MDLFADAMAAGHAAAKAAIKAQRPDLPVGWSIAIIDDVVIGDDTSVRDRKRAEVYEKWLTISCDDDFVGVQNYERHYFDGNSLVPAPEGIPRNQMGSAIEPLSLAGAVRYAYDKTAVPIMVTEHGMGTDDDGPRAAFIEPALRGLLDLIEEGIPVVGYTHWTLLDNFEWIFGYTMHLGLVAVDRTTFARTPKPSATIYSRIASANAVTAS